MIGDIPVVMLSSAICSVHTIVVLLTAPVELIVIITCGLFNRRQAAAAASNAWCLRLKVALGLEEILYWVVVGIGHLSVVIGVSAVSPNFVSDLATRMPVMDMLLGG